MRASKFNESQIVGILKEAEAGVPMSARLKAVLELRQYAPDGKEHPSTAYVFGNEVGEKVGEKVVHALRLMLFL